MTPSGLSSVLQITGVENQLAIFEVNLHFPVVRVLEQGMLRFCTTGGFAFLLTRFDKAHLVLFPCDVSKTGRLLAIEASDKFQERLFDVKEDRVVPPCVATLFKGKFAVYKQMVQSTVTGVAEDTC